MPPTMMKPTKIILIGAGAILVTYVNRGEILTENSKQGSKMALKVMNAFQDLLSMVSAANVRR